MATNSGQITTYNATNPHKRVVSDRILMTDPMEIPLVAALGLRNEAKFSFLNWPGKMYEWLEDTYAPTSDTAADTGITNSSTTTTITVTDGDIFQAGDVIKIDDEYIWVSSVSANVLTVTRNFGGTQATHASTSTVYLHYNSRLEGANAGNSPSTESTTGYNYSTILQKTINVSRTDGRIRQYGIDSVVDREIDKAMDEKKLQLTRIPYHGQRKAGSATTPRGAGGLATFISTNTTALSSAALTQKNLEDSMANCWAYGGVPNLLVCGSWIKRKIASFYAPYVQTERSENMGGVTIDWIQSPLGFNVAVLVDRHIPTDTVYLLDTRYVGFVTIDEFFYEELGKVGDSADRGYGEVVGEYGFVVAAEKRHAKISGASTSS